MLLNDEGVSFHSTLILTSVEVYHVLSLLSHPQHQWVDLLVRVTLGKHFDIRAHYTCWDEVTIAGTSAALVFIQLVLCLRFLFFILLLLGSAKWTWIYHCVVLLFMWLQVKEAAMSADALLGKNWGIANQGIQSLKGVLGLLGLLHPGGPSWNNSPMRCQENSWSVAWGALALPWAPPA